MKWLPSIAPLRLLVGVLPLLTVPALAAAGSAPDLEAGRRTFESVCAACHGPTGRADPENPVVKALDALPADLSDPLFNSREPAEDWDIVVTHGGQALGLSATMPAQGAALDEQQIRNVVAYAEDPGARERGLTRPANSTSTSRFAPRRPSPRTRSSGSRG